MNRDMEGESNKVASKSVDEFWGRRSAVNRVMEEESS